MNINSALCTFVLSKKNKASMEYVPVQMSSVNQLSIAIENPKHKIDKENCNKNAFLTLRNNLDYEFRYQNSRNSMQAKAGDTHSKIHGFLIITKLHVTVKLFYFIF